MILSAVDLVIEIDFETDKPGAILQRKEKGYWHNYLVDGKPGSGGKCAELGPRCKGNTAVSMLPDLAGVSGD